MTTFFSFLRVKQWVKNIFVLAPLLFSRKWLSLDTARWDILDALLGFCTFCLISSAVYVLNDIMDIRQDRLHPVKKRRPLASGAVSLRMAVVCAISLCVCAAFFIIIIGNLMAAFWAIVYFALMILYSVWLKNVPLVDVVAIAAGFMIRVVFGAAVICVDASPFILLTTGALSLFLGVSKRKAELIRMKNMTYTRNVLAFYTPERTTILLSVTGTDINQHKVVVVLIHICSFRTVIGLHADAAKINVLCTIQCFYFNGILFTVNDKYTHC